MCIFSLATSQKVECKNLNIKIPKIIPASSLIDVVIELKQNISGELPVTVNFKNKKLQKIVNFTRGKGHLEISIPFTGKIKLEFNVNNLKKSINVKVIPGCLSILPPVLAIILALLIKDVIVALLLGLFAGTLIITNFNPITGCLLLLEDYILSSFTNQDHGYIIIFSLMLGGMVGVIATSGGAAGIVKLITKFAKTVRSGQLSAWFMGVFIFFDDYANTLLVGNTMRPLTDKLRISREKLSYIVDSTAAPVASLALISTWIGYEIGLIGDAIKSNLISLKPIANFVSTTGVDSYIVFLKSIPFRFYSIFTLVFVFLIALLVRDFGAMYKAELRTRKTGKVLSDDAVPLTDTEFENISSKEIKTPQARFAIVPIGTMIVLTIVGLYLSGKNAILSKGLNPANFKLYEIISEASSFSVLLISTFISSLIAILMSVFHKILSLKKAVNAWVTGCKSMTLAMITLILAWSISKICGTLGTASYIHTMFSGFISPVLLPTIIFLTSSLIAFATGTSWGTMGILLPIAVGLCAKILANSGLTIEHSSSILLCSISAVLAGATFGDHCSPISDTTIMSSMASSADHIDHVKTQMPYALTTAGTAIICGYLLAGAGINPLISIVSGIALLTIIILVFGKRTDIDTIFDTLVIKAQSDNFPEAETALKRIASFSNPKAAYTLIRLYKKCHNKDLLNLIVSHLNNLGNAALPALYEAYEKEDKKTANMALKILTKLAGEEAIELFLEALKKEDEEIKINAIYALSRISGRKYTDKLLLMLSDSSEKVKATAISVLSKLGTKNLYPRLEVLLNDTDERIKANAIEAFLFLPKLKNEEIITKLSPFLNDKSGRVKANTAMVLFEITKNDLYINKLEEMLKSENIAHKKSAIYALSKINTGKSVSILLTSLKKENKEIIKVAKSALNEAGNPALAELLESLNF